jgi:diguanylate cyclase (GGDEF)-like protein
MHEIPLTEATAESVDREIEHGFRALIFAPDLERRYENDTRRYREIYLIRALQMVFVLYYILAICDWVLLPDVFVVAMIARVAVFTPVSLMCWFVLSRGPSMRVREGVASVFVVFSVALMMGGVVSSRSSDIVLYEYLPVLAIIYTALVQRTRFRFAVATTLGVSAIQIIACMHLRLVTPRAMVGIVFFYFIASALVIWAAYGLEREHRRSYLLDLRSRILNDHLDHIAKHDALTGLSNRRRIDTEMTRVWFDAKADPRSMSVILLDIDHFKAFNDSLGHLAGDRCLRRLADCVRAATDGNEKAMAVRFGGEEFLVFIDGADLATAQRVAERIQAAIRQSAIPHPALGDGATVTASFGIASGQAPKIAFERLVAIADDGLYAAKRAGRDRILPSASEAPADALQRHQKIP